VQGEGKLYGAVFEEGNGDKIGSVFASSPACMPNPNNSYFVNSISVGYPVIVYFKSMVSTVVIFAVLICWVDFGICRKISDPGKNIIF